MRGEKEWQQISHKKQCKQDGSGGPFLRYWKKIFVLESSRIDSSVLFFSFKLWLHMNFRISLLISKTKQKDRERILKLLKSKIKEECLAGCQ